MQFLEDGRKCKSTVTMEGDNKLVVDQIAIEPGKKSLKTIREFTDDGINLEITCEDSVSRQYFQRQV